MSVDLETLALIAAAVSKPLRASIDASEFHPSQRVLIDALNDGKTRESREVVARWLATLGVDWDGKSEIGSAIVATHKERKRRRRAQTQLETALLKLKYPALAGAQGVESAVNLAEVLEGVQREFGATDGKADSGSRPEVHAGRNGSVPVRSGSE